MDPRSLDAFFRVWFVVFTVVSLTTDAYGLRLAWWPPAPVRRALHVYIELVDPFFDTDALWHRICIAIEVLTFPAYHLAALYALRRPVFLASRAFLVWTTAYVTAIAYSFALILGENFLSAAAPIPPVPAAYLAVYLPFLVVPLTWCARVAAETHPEKRSV